MRTIIIAAALVAACTDPNDDEGRVVGVHARPATIYERETIE